MAPLTSSRKPRKTSLRRGQEWLVHDLAGTRAGPHPRG